MKTEEKAEKNKNKFYKEKFRGISLIVLVITIIVIIILAAAVILTLNNNNPISEANKARYESDVANMQAIFTNTVAKVMAQNQGTIEVNAGELNSVKTGGSSTEGRVNYTVNSPLDSSNENGTIIFNTGTNNATTYYTGRMLPIYSIGETTWYVDSEGVISLKVGGEEYGKGEQINNPSSSQLKEGEIALSDNPMLQSWTVNNTTDFHNPEYKSKITIVKFATADKVSEDKIESWDVSQARDKSVMAWVEGDGDEGYILTIAGRSKVVANTDSSNLFNGFTNIKEIQNLKILDVSNVTDMRWMFKACSSLTSIDVSNFDTSNVTAMQSMFYDCSSLTSIDVSHFNTSNVTTMSLMFCNCSSLTSMNVSNFDTVNVTTMQSMFYGCTSLANIDVSNFDTSNVTNMTYMFRNCYKLKTTINIIGNEINEYNNMFLNAATESTAKITVNYTSDTSSLVDNMIATKSNNSNVEKGTQIIR